MVTASPAVDYGPSIPAHEITEVNKSILKHTVIFQTTVATRFYVHENNEISIKQNSIHENDFMEVFMDRFFT